MASSKEIRSKVSSVQNTKKITKAMEMVASSKMRKAQERMQKGRPYADKLRNVTAHMSRANPEYKHPFMLAPEKPVNRVGVILVSTDKGLCGGLNTNAFRILTDKMIEWSEQGVGVEAIAIGSKGNGFLNRLGVSVVAQVSQLGDVPKLDALLGPLKVILSDFIEGKLDAIYLCHTQFLNTMTQKPVFEQFLPLGEGHFEQTQAEISTHAWDYIYEPEARTVIDFLMRRYVEALIYQAVAENMASEQSARMVAMKAATDNAAQLINDLNILYNKSRQAAITTELSEIVAGAAAV
ncbi:MAG: F0F1 ATP synthase subunit gamma [Saezia sp.]